MATSKTLLSLPSEIRNRIYMFTLGGRNLLYYCGNDASSTYKPSFYIGAQLGLDKPTEFNELKRVNRQLYFQTAGLELKYYSVLIFHST